MASITLRAGDTAPSLPIVCTRAGKAIDLTGATVRLIISNSAGTRTNSSHDTCTITSATSGTCTYNLQSGDISTADTYTADTEITYSNGNVETVPQSEFLVVLEKN